MEFLQRVLQNALKTTTVHPTWPAFMVRILTLIYAGDSFKKQYFSKFLLEF